MIARAWMVHYGNTLHALTDDLGKADRMVVDLHAHGVDALYQLTTAELAYLQEMPCAQSPLPQQS